MGAPEKKERPSIGPLALLLTQGGPKKPGKGDEPDPDEQLDSIAEEAMAAMKSGDKKKFKAALRSFIHKAR